MNYVIRKSKRKHKKYDVYVNDKYLLSFGDSRYGQFKDTTPLKSFSSKDHNDKKRRTLYYKRHGVDAVKYSPKWFSHKYLW